MKSRASIHLKDVKKVKRLISATLTPPAAAESLEPDNKRRKTDSVTDRDLDHDIAEWVRCGCHVLTQYDKNVNFANWTVPHR